MPLLNSICKRCLDVLLASAGLLAGAPLLLVIALFVWLDHPGPVIFSQSRLGKDGKPFRLHKFRKFAPDWGDQGPGVTVRADARMTRVGKILERTKLDELPQLWNILKGEMSFVGPRPESLRFQELFAGKYSQVLQFIPGIFGPNQIAYRNEADMYPADEKPDDFYRRILFPAKAGNDLAYFSQASCARDIEWIVRGLWVSLVGAVPWRRFMGLHAKILLTDVLMVVVGWTLAYALRFSDFQTSVLGLQHFGNEISNTMSGRFSWREIVDGLWLVPSIIIASMLIGGCYRVPVRHFSLPDAVRLFWMVGIGWMLAFLALIGFASRGISILLFPIGGALIMGLLFLPRILARRRDLARPSAGEIQHQRRILIYGGSAAGAAIARWIRTGIPGARLIGFLDDDQSLLDRTLVDSRVLGRESDLPLLKEVHDITELWVHFQPDHIKRHRLRATCDELGVSLFFLADIEPFASSNPVRENDEKQNAPAHGEVNREIGASEVHGHSA